jgi:hypothetical protein
MPTDTFYLTDDADGSALFANGSAGMSMTDSASVVRVGIQSGEKFSTSLVAFLLADLSSLAGQTISAATLSVEISSANDDSGSSRAAAIRRVTAAWDEGDSESPAYDDATSWGTIGTDGATWGAASTVVTSSDISSLLQAWADGTYTNYGVALDPQDVASYYRRFKATETSGTADDPYFTVTYNTAPAISVTSPADGATTLDATIDLVVSVTDPDASQTLTVTWQVATDSGFSNIVFTDTDTEPTPAADVAKTITTSSLSVDTLYYWRANVSDGDDTSAWTATRTFYVDRTPVPSDTETLSGIVAPGNQTIDWGYTDADSDAQAKYYLRRVYGATTEYWNGAAWQSGEVGVSSSSNSVSVPFTGEANQITVSVAVEDGFGSKSSYVALASFYCYDDPTVTIDAPAEAASLTTGGPTLSVSWTYDQAQSLAQSNYRVQLTDDAGTTEYYDSGTLAGATATMDIDLVAEGVPTDTTDLKVTVTVTAASSGSTGTDTNEFDVLWGVVTCTVVDPTAGEVWTATRVTAEWSFASSRSKTQDAYRVRLLLGGNVLHDSGWVSDAVATTYEVPFDLGDGSTYQVGVQLRNSEGVES